MLWNRIGRPPHVGGAEKVEEPYELAGFQGGLVFNVKPVDGHRDYDYSIKMRSLERSVSVIVVRVNFNSILILIGQEFGTIPTGLVELSGGGRR